MRGMNRFECPKCPKLIETDNRHNKSLGVYKVFTMGNYFGLKCKRCGNTILIKRMNYFIDRLREMIASDKLISDSNKKQMIDTITKLQKEDKSDA